MIPADPVLDGELIEDTNRADAGRVLASWWRRCPRIPAVLTSRAHATQAAKATAVVVVRSPWRFVSAAGRGTVLAGRAWRRWVTVRDYREAAEQSEKLADKYLEIRELTLLRWRVTGAVAGSGTAVVALADRLWWLA